MSRNLQRKSTATPAQKTVQKSSAQTDESSDDGGYDGVDQISDSEDDDEPDVEAAEEDVIRAFPDDDEALAPRPKLDDESVVDLPSPSFFNEHVEAIEPNYSSGSSNTAGSPDRRVHFDLSDADSESEEDNDYPFFDIDSLAPHFRQLIDEDEKEPTSDNEGWWPSEESEEDAADEDAADEAEDLEATDSNSADSSSYSSR